LYTPDVLWQIPRVDQLPKVHQLEVS
jgi:hypothetical protein